MKIIDTLNLSYEYAEQFEKENSKYACIEILSKKENAGYGYTFTIQTNGLTALQDMFHLGIGTQLEMMIKQKTNELSTT